MHFPPKNKVNSRASDRGKWVEIIKNIACKIFPFASKLAKRKRNC